MRLCSVGCWLLVSACGGDSTEPSASDKVRALLIAGEWPVQSVQVNGVDRTSVYTGLSLRFTQSSYSTTQGRAVWPGSGTWQFTDDSATTLLRNDGLEVRIGSITHTRLELELTWTQQTLGHGRIASVAGRHVFVFVK